MKSKRKSYGKRLRLSKAEEELIYQHRATHVENVNDNTALTTHLKERGIDPEDVVSVKHWQSASGEYRFSVVTRENLGIKEKEIFNKVSKFLAHHAPEYKPVKRNDNNKDPHLLVINPADIHIGKYANEKEAGDKYNTKIAIDRVLEGVNGLIHKAKGFKIEQILFCIGNDVLHVDNVYNTTTKGTRQDTDGKWWEHYEKALQLYVKCVEILRKVAKVDVVHSMSNHDYQSGFHLAHTLQSWFRNAHDVSFDISVAHRKYYKYGTSLIGLEHGDGARLDNLPLLMAQERPELWASTKTRYWYLHHLHHKIKYKWRDAKDYIGVTVEYMRSPSSSDSWHARKGYTGAPRACEGFIHHKELGQVARLTHFF
tara:strand:- start:36852 stop:37958 length:1107 start_codon:yes stop_codon:yes gene_type:complete